MMRVCPKCHGCLTEPVHAPCNELTTEVEVPELSPALAEKFSQLVPLAQGATGMLFRATHVETGVSGVLKLVHAAVSGTGTERMRLKRELRKQTTLPGAVLAPPIDGGEDGKQLWLFREYVEGVSLSLHVATLAAAGEAMPIAHSLSIVAQVAVGLDELHRNGLLHRDLKPAHVVLDFASNDAADAAPKVRLIDAGLPPRIGAEGVFDLMGTPGYMSPEQAAGRIVSFRSDLYSLGCIFHELVAGKPLFSGDIADILAAQREGLVPEVEQSLPDVARDLLRTLLDKEPRRRPFSAQQVRRSLEPSLDGPLPSVPAPRVTREKARGFVGASVPPPPPAASRRPPAGAAGRRSVAPPVPAAATGRPSAPPPPPPGGSRPGVSVPPPPPPSSSSRSSSVPPIPLQGRPGANAANATQELQLGDVQIQASSQKRPPPHGRPVEKLHTAELRVMTLDEDEHGNERPTQMLGTGEIEIVATPGPRTQHLDTREFQTLMVDESTGEADDLIEAAADPAAELAEAAAAVPAEDTDVSDVDSVESEDVDSDDGDPSAETSSAPAEPEGRSEASQAEAGSSPELAAVADNTDKAPQPEPSIVFNHDSSTPPPTAPRRAVDFDVESLFGADHSLGESNAEATAGPSDDVNDGSDSDSDVEDDAPTIAFDRTSLNSSMPPVLADSTGNVQLQIPEDGVETDDGPTVAVSAAEMADLAKASKGQAADSGSAIPGWAYGVGAAAALVLVLWMLSGDDRSAAPAVAGSQPNSQPTSKEKSAADNGSAPVATSQKPSLDSKAIAKALPDESTGAVQGAAEYGTEPASGSGAVESAKTEVDANSDEKNGALAPDQAVTTEQEAAELGTTKEAADTEQESAEVGKAEQAAKAEEVVKAEPIVAKPPSSQAAAKRRKPPAKADVDALKADARKYFAAKKFPRAARAYKRVTKAAPRDSGAFAGLGASQLAMGDAKAAVVAYRRAVKLRPKTSGFHAALGRAYYESGDKKRARAAYKQALVLNPKNKAAQAAMARLK